MESADERIQAEVVLVHGTQFWRGPETPAEAHRLCPWTDPKHEGSLASKIAALKEGETDVTLSAFPWKGRNTTAAREEAAKKLEIRLKENPGCDKVIVAHSHGGNVAVRALQRLASTGGEGPGEEAHGRILGVVCLATPFLQLLPRDPHAILWLRQVGVLFLLLTELFAALLSLTMALIGLIGIFQQFLGGPLQELPLWLTLVFFVGGLLGLGLIYLFHGWLLRTNLEAKKKVNAIQKQALGNHGNPIETPFLCVRAAGDEAGAWLNFWATVSALPYVLRNRVLSSIGIAGLTVTGLWLWESPFTRGENDSLAIDLLLAAAFWLAVASGVYFLLTTLALAVAHGIQWLPITFGSRQMKSSLTHTVVSLTPLYAQHVQFEAYAGSSVLVHKIYMSKTVQEDVVEWIRRRIHGGGNDGGNDAAQNHPLGRD